MGRGKEMIKSSLRVGQYLSFTLAMIVVLNSCIPSEPMNRDHRSNFEALWKIMDERYCYFEEKGVDWQAIHDIYGEKLKEKDLNELEFFNLMGDMLAELRDGHVNLISSFDVTSYSDWQGDATEGLNIYARAKELPGNKLVSGGMLYQKYKYMADQTLRFGYISYDSFSSGLGSLNLIRNYLSDVDGIIIDLRGNGGGTLDNSTTFLSRFFEEKTLVGYMSHKYGPGHEDFTELRPIYIEPYDKKEDRWVDKPVIVLQDRSCYSAANDFLTKIDLAKNVVRIGLKSGGGGGLPATQELPNGWKVRYSSVRNFDANKRSTESGLDPDIEVSGVSYYTDPSAPDLILRYAIAYLYEMFHTEAPSGTSGMYAPDVTQETIILE